MKSLTSKLEGHKLGHSLTPPRGWSWATMTREANNPTVSAFSAFPWKLKGLRPKSHWGEGQGAVAVGMDEG